MVTKFNTGDNILIPATIKSAREENGVVIYEVDANLWEGIPEDQIIVNEAAASRKAVEEGFREMIEEGRFRY